MDNHQEEEQLKQQSLHILDLPNEMIEEIFSFVQSSDLKNLRLVNWRFFDCGKKRINRISYYDDRRDQKDVINLNNHVRCLDVKYNLTDSTINFCNKLFE